jgi:ATP-binding cassette subfamily C protein
MFDYNFGKDIRLFNMKDILVDKFMEQRDIKQKLNISVEKKMFGFSLFEGIFYFVREVLVYTVLLTVYLNNQLTIDNFLMYVSLVASFGIISKGITEDIGKIVELSRYITDYRGFVDEEDDDDEQDNLKKVLEQKQWDSFTIEFKNVSFKYPNSEKYVLKNINFVIEKGDHISIVGFNGSGKTTIVKLLCRFYEPTDGAIYFNGVNIAEYSKKSCRKSISAVFQESKLFAFSMLENITLDSEELNKEEFWKVIESVGMKKKIEELNNKEYANVLKNLYDGGVEFSGGEKQRLYIARAMFKDNHLLLLDEPTAALDALAEKKIYENFSEISKGKTTIFISHRLNSNKFCNKVILLEQGKIVAQGSHEDMLLKCEAYKSLYQMQAHYYIDTKDWGSTAYETI